MVKSKMKLQKGDLVKIISGKYKGKTAKVISILPDKQAVKVEGLNIVKRHVKPNILSPQGGISEIHKPIDVSKVALVVDQKTKKISRIGYVIQKDGTKVRVARQAKNKEIDS